MAHPWRALKRWQAWLAEILQKFFGLFAVSIIENTACGHRIDDERQLCSETYTTSWYTSAPTVQVYQQRLALLQGAE